MDQSRTVPAENGRNLSTGPAKNIVETIGVGNLTSFGACVKAARMTDALAAKGPFTVFAPSDEAFSKLPAGAYEALLKDPAKLKAVLNYHVVPGYHLRRDVKAGEIVTLQGSALTATASPTELHVNGALVSQADILATNGVIHTIDAVILPKNWQLVAAAA